MEFNDIPGDALAERYFSGVGSPEGVVTASVGDGYVDTGNNHLYKKVTGTATNTGWQDVSVSGLGGTSSLQIAQDTYAAVSGGIGVFATVIDQAAGRIFHSHAGTGADQVANFVKTFILPDDFDSFPASAFNIDSMRNGAVDAFTVTISK